MVITRQYRQIKEFCNEILHDCNNINWNLLFVIILFTIRCYRVWVNDRGVKGTTHIHIYICIYFCIVSTHDKHAGLMTEIPLHRVGPSKTSPVLEPRAILLLSEVFTELKTSQKHFPDSYQRCSEIGILGKMRAKEPRRMSKCSS